MQLKPVDEREALMLLNARKIRPTKLMELLDQFMISDQKIVEIDWSGSYASAKSCAGSFNVSIKRAHVGAEVMIRGERVFLLKKTV